MNSWLKSFIQKLSNKESAQYLLILMVLLGSLLLCASFAALCYGSTDYSITEVFQALIKGNEQDALYRIILYVRLPRLLAAILAGSALAVSGVILQAVLNNALAGPNIIGVNAGSGLFVMLCLTFLPYNAKIVPFAAFIGALLATLLIYFIASKTGTSRITIVLAGVAVSNLMKAIMDVLKTCYPDVIIGANSFMMGGLNGVSMNMVQFATIYILIGLLLAFLFSHELNVLSLGDQIAKTLGMRVQATRFILIVIASLLAGSAVSIVGLLGFVGLIVPHACRFLVGSNNRVLVVVSAFVGAIFLIVCDVLSKLIFAPFEVPVGIMMSFIGVPFFIYLLFSQKRGRLND